MSELSLQDAYLLEKVVDPNSQEFNYLLGLLVKPTGDDRTTAQRLNARPQWKYTLPYRGEPEDELELKDYTPFKFSERAPYRNGVASLALAAADVVDLIAMSSSKSRMTPTVCVSEEGDSYAKIMESAGGASSLMFYAASDEVQSTILEVMPETMIYDHTTVASPIDEVLNMAYRMGVHVVDGVFPYHVAAMKGWNVVSGLGKWSFTHSAKSLTVGPDDDCTRLIKYSRDQYLRFLEPSRWTGNSKKYGYEIRKCHNGLATYRAVYLGGAEVELSKEHLSFSLPMCSSEDMVMVTVNRDLAAGVFTSKSNNAQDLAKIEKNYAIEVRRDLFVSCIDYLISKVKGADIVGESVRYVAEHNYVDLMDGVRVVRRASLSYADALCVSMTCALTAFSLRYRLTNESLPDIRRHIKTAQMNVDAPFGTIGRLAWMFGTYVGDAVSNVFVRAREAAREMLFNNDYIPGVCFDVYMSVHYSPDLDWFEPYNPRLEQRLLENDTADADDAFTSFLGDNVKTAAPTVYMEKSSSKQLFSLSEHNYIHNVVPDPIQSFQHVYDQAFPGNSTAQLQNVAELRRVKDVDINTEFYGRIEINKDVAAPEQLHQDAPVRTSALPVGATPLVDAIMASAKRNFNPPDIQMQNDPWEYAKYLTDKFVDWAFIPGFKKTLQENYQRDLLTFNVADYLEWLALKGGAYKTALEAECAGELLELGLEKYDTIVKRRIKPKLNTSAQHELAQPQVIVSNSKKDTALFTSLFRKIFERFDNALRPEIKSAGRLSDDAISEWLTEHLPEVVAFPAVEIDSSKYDKSQGLLARMIEALVMQKLGLDPQVSEIFEDSYVGRVSSKSLGLMFVSAYQMKSGAPQTMLGNLIYNMVSVMESMGVDNIRMMIAKGDDNIVWLLKEVAGDAEVARISGLFNLEAKLLTKNVLYFSSGYVVPVGDRLYFVPDPLKLLELLGEMGASASTLAERFISFQDRVRSITRDHGIPPVLQRLVRLRLGVPDLDVIMAVDSLASLAANYGLFEEAVSRVPAL